MMNMGLTYWSMLEFLRKHKMVVLGAMVLVFVGLVFIERNGGSGGMPGRGDVLFTVGDTSYTTKDEISMGETALRVCYPIQSLSDQIKILMTGKTTPGADFMLNRAIIREEAKRLGVNADKDTVDLYIKQMPEFQDETGNFNVDLYRKFIGARHNMPQNREREDLVRSVIADVICFEQLQNIILRHMEPNEAFVSAWTKSALQEVTVSLAVFNKASFMPKSEPSETEIKAFWEKRKGDYNSEEERIITLYTFIPTTKPEIKEGDSKIPASTMQLFDTVENLWTAIYDANGKQAEQKIQSTVEAYKDSLNLEREQFPLTSISKAPEELLATLNPLSGPKKPDLIQTAFNITQAPSLDSYNEHSAKNSLESIALGEQISETCVRNDGSVSLIRVDAIKPVGPLSYEDAKELAKRDLMSEIANEAMEKATQALYAKLSKATNLTEEFEKISQEAGATLKHYGPYDLRQQPEGFEASQTVYNAVQKINPGQITKPLISQDEAIIAELIRRSIIVSPEMGAQAAQINNLISLQTEQDIINDWFQSCMNRYKVKITPRLAPQEQQEQP